VKFSSYACTTWLTFVSLTIGHVDAGKSTLMGKLLHELGELSDKEVATNQRQSQKIGKGSFAYAWAFDSTKEERERCGSL
jgi:elongation factor 1 alpha-like protein